MFILIVLVIILLIAYSMYQDYSRGQNNSFNLNQFNKRRPTGISAAEDYYVNYWVWEKNKKAAFVKHFADMGLSPYVRHSRKTGDVNKSSWVPFRREVFCANK